MLIPLCEHCSSSVVSLTTAPNVSVVFCMNDGVFLCATCNDEVHRNKIAQRHVRVPYSDAPAWAYQEALAAGRVTSQGQAGECSSSPNTEPACLTLDVVGESSWTPPAQPATASSLDSAQPAYKSESASCGMNAGIPHHKKQPSLLSHYTMAISTPDTFSDEAGAHHSNSNSYTPGSLGAEVAQEETQHNAPRLKLLGPASEPTPQQQQRMQHLPTQPLQHSGPLTHSVFSMQTIQEQQVMGPLSGPSIQHQQQLYAMRHPHGSNSNQGSAHGGMSFYGVPPPCPLNRCGSQEPSAHGGAVSVDTTTVAGSANSHQSLAAMLERFGMPGSREPSHHGPQASPLSNGATGGLSANLEGSVHSTGTASGLPPHMRTHPAQQQQQQQQQPSSLKSSQTDLVVGQQEVMPHMGSAHMSSFRTGHTSQPLASHPSSQGLHPAMLNIGVEEGSVPPSRHGPQAPHRQPDLGHAHKVQKLGGQSPFLAPKEQSIKDVIMAEVGLPRVHMPTAMDEDLPGEGPGATATALTPPGSGTGAGTGRDSSMAETLGMPPTHAAAAKHPHPHPQRPEHTSSGMANNPASGSTEGLGMFPSPWHSHQGLPSEQPFQQPFQQQGQQQSQQQGQHQHQHQLGQPPGSGPMHPNFSTLPPELLSTLQHGNSAAQHYHHQQQQQQQPPEMEQLPMGFTYRPTAFQLSALNIEATPQSVIEARARALINSSSRTKGGSQQQRNHKGAAQKASKTAALDDSDSDESGSIAKLKKGTKAKQVDKKGRAKATTDQRLRGRGHMAKAEGIEGDLGAGLYRVGSGLDRSVRGGCMQRIDEEVDQAANLKGRAAPKSKQGTLNSPRTSASPRPSLQRTSSGSHGGSASAGSTAKGGGSSKGAKGLGSASGGVVKNSGHHAHGGQGGSTLRRALSCTDMSLDQSVMQKLVAAIQANPSAAPSSLLPNLPPQLQQQVLRSLGNPAFQQQLQHQRGSTAVPFAMNKPSGSMPVPVSPQPPLPACTNPALTWEGNMGGLLAGASSWSHPNLLAGPSSWSHPNLLAAQEETRHGSNLNASAHGGSFYLDSLGGGACVGEDRSTHSRAGVDRSVHGGTEGSTHGGNSVGLWGAGDGLSTQAGSTLCERSTHGGSLFGEGGSVHGGTTMLGAPEAEHESGCLASELLASLDQEQGDMLGGGSSMCGGGMGADGSLHGGSIFGGLGLERLDDNKLQTSFQLPPPGSHDEAAAPQLPGLAGMREVGEPEQSPLITDEDLEALCVMDPAQGPGALPLSKPFSPTAIAPSLKLGSSSPRPDHHAFPFPHHLHNNGGSMVGMRGLSLQRRSEPGPSPLGPAHSVTAFGGAGASRLQNSTPVSMQALQMQLGPQVGHENPGYNHDVFADQQVCSMLDALLDDHV